MKNKENELVKYTFSGHDSFQCRQLWLKKGYDYIKARKTFNDDDAVVELGVGKNMVASINFWMKAFGILSRDNELTEFANFIFDTENGKDPFLEDEATLWLLHYNLVTLNYATTYNLIFNDLRRERIEFTKEHFIGFIQRKADEQNMNTINKNTLATDFEVLTKMYLRSTAQLKDREDTFSGILTELNLVQEEVHKNSDKQSTYISIPTDEKNEIPEDVILYCILDNNSLDKSISLYNIEQDRDNIGSVFAINRESLVQKIENIATNNKYKKYGIVFNDHAGIKELQFKIKPNKYEVLKNYYGN